jgi:hypothetical protein
LSLYKAEMAGYVQGVFSTLQGNVSSAFGTLGYTFGNVGTAQYSLLQTSVTNEISNATTQIGNLLSPLKKSKNLMGVVQTEMVNLSAEVNGLLNKLATTATTTGGVTRVDSDSEGLTSTTVSLMMSSVSYAVENQVNLFLFAPGVSTKPGKAFLASMFSTYNSALSTPFSNLTSGLQGAIAANVASPNTAVFQAAVYAQLGALSLSASGVFASNGAPTPVFTAGNAQVGGLNSGSIYQVITGWTFGLDTTITYPVGFVNYAISNLDSVLQTDLAATGSA